MTRARYQRPYADPQSNGCGVGFISWLLSQQKTLPEVAQAMVKLGDGGTLAELYNNLTGDDAAKAWPNFKAAVEALPDGVTSDDPFGAKP